MSSSSVIHRLPSELWLCVFRLALQSAEASWLGIENVGQHRGTLLTTPFTLSAICKHWRAICLKDTALWDRVYLWLPPYAVRPTYNPRDDEIDADRDLLVTDRFISHVDAFQLWIERSGGRKVSITLRLKRECTSLSFGDQHAMRVPSIIAAHAGHIEELDIALSEKWYPVLNKLEFPLLKALKLWIPEMRPQSGRFNEWDPSLRGVRESLDLSACPQLTSIQIDGSYRYHSRVTLPWTQIHESHTPCMRPPVYREILDLMPNIRRCTLEAGEFEDYPIEDDDVDDLDMLVSIGRRGGEWALESLIIDGFDLGSAKVLLDHSPLTLREISLRAFSPLRRTSLDTELLLSLRPFSATLRSLSLTEYVVQDFDGLLIVLECLTLLEFITFNVGTEARGIDENFLSAFNAPSFLPNLERISIQTTTFQFGAETLLALLRLRGYGRPLPPRPTKKILEVNLNAFRVTDGASMVLRPEQVDEIVRMKEQGLILVVECRASESDMSGRFVPWYWILQDQS